MRADSCVLRGRGGRLGHEWPPPPALAISPYINIYLWIISQGTVMHWSRDKDLADHWKNLRQHLPYNHALDTPVWITTFSFRLKVALKFRGEKKLELKRK